ncbi:MAG: flagellar hook-associated protein FlgK [Clostridia bacterium]|jgi:flagellar hook-associated protein 1 FlgK
MSTFSGIEIVRKSLYANQKAIDITGHNIANANTKGYTRQQVVFESIADNSKTLFAGTSVNNIGRGVEIAQIKQVRYDYYDSMYRKEAGIQNELSAKSSGYIYINSLMRNGRDDSIGNMLTDLFDSMENLASNADNMIIREEVKQNAILFTENMNMTADALIQYKNELNGDIKEIASNINDMAYRLVELNKLIFEFEATGKTANELRDERNLIVDDLSQYMNITVNEKDNGEFQVMTGGYSLVDHYTVQEIEVKNNLPSDVVEGTYNQLYWKNAGSKVILTGGQLKGMLDLRDGSTQENMGIDYVIKQLDNLAGSIVEQFNNINRAGYTLPYSDHLSVNEVDFFDSLSVKATNIRISDALKDDVSNIAASDISLNDNIGLSNNRNLMNYLELRESSSLMYGTVSIGNLEDYIESAFSKITITTGYAQARASSQNEILDYISGQRDSVSGVSITEETINLTAYQKSYEATANLMKVIDEMLDTLMNIV